MSDATTRAAPDDEVLSAWLLEDFALRTSTLDAVTGGTDDARSWRCRSTEGASYAVKWSAGGTPAGVLVASRLAGQGLTGVPAPLRTTRGHLWSERDGRRLTVHVWAAGSRALSAVTRREHWVAFGRLLAQVHATPVDGGLAAELPDRVEVHDRVLTNARAELDLLARAEAHGRRSPPPDRLVRELLERWRGVDATVRSIAAQVERLHDALVRGGAEPVLCHSDPHLGNLLLAGDAAVHLVDWDDSALAPRERDLVSVLGGGVLAFAPVTEVQQRWFLDGYGDAEVRVDELAYQRAVRLLEDLVGPAAEVLDVQGRSPDERREALEIVTGVLSPTGLLRQTVSSLAHVDQPAPPSG